MKAALKKLGIWLLILPWAAYVPYWWSLVFDGYYDDKMSPEMVERAKLFLPADLFLALVLVCTIIGIRKRMLLGYAGGFLICGAMIYISIQTGSSIIAGSLPRDLATQLIVWPYLCLGIIGVFFLYRDLRQHVGTHVS